MRSQTPRGAESESAIAIRSRIERMPTTCRAVGDRQVAEAAVHHQRRRMLGRLVRADRVRIRRHPVAHDRVVSDPAGDRAQHVTLGQNSRQPLAVEHQHGADGALDHLRRHIR
jgi:hypothetical protein